MSENEQGPQQENLNNSVIAIATTTFYKNWSSLCAGTSPNTDQVRGDLVIEAIKLAKNKGYQIAVVDGGSSEDFRGTLSALGVRLVDQGERSMSASRRWVFQEAMSFPGIKAICWTEPEKASMVEHLEEAVKPILEGHADIVIPARTEESYMTYPKQQVKNEQKANHLFNKVLRLSGLLSEDSPDIDTFFGPRIFRNDPEIIQLFTRKYQLKENSRLTAVVKPDSYLNSTFFPIMLALEKKLRVISVPIEYQHPQRQTDFETGNTEFEIKRKKQKQDIVSGTIQLARLFINNPQKPSELFAPDNS